MSIRIEYFSWKGPQRSSSPTAWPTQGWPKVKACY